MKATKRHKKHRKKFLILCLLCFFVAADCRAQVLGDPVDVSQDFQRLENVYFIWQSRHFV